MNKQEILNKIANLETELGEMKKAVKQQSVAITHDLITKVAKAVTDMIDESNINYVKDFDISLDRKEIELDEIDFNTWELEKDIEKKIQQVLKQEGVMVVEEVVEA
jgi:DNA primase catalytic subunit